MADENLGKKRRAFLERTGSGFGMLALSSLMGRSMARAATMGAFTNPLAAKPQHFPAKAKSVIYLFMHGGPSHVDTFDPKPALTKYDGSDKVHVHDLRATLLGLLGEDHKRLTYLYQGRDFRPCDVGGDNNLAGGLIKV
jgi:hypothetical protein